jgi:hypothetical protein
LEHTASGDRGGHFGQSVFFLQSAIVGVCRIPAKRTSQCKQQKGRQSENPRKRAV